uniref:Uncharacterized protein n=1 Tax=Thermosporothrix sp. COM3 TaxID=2490863 RepID=A0A455SIG9_9CHLR|nr:hypothetical protein KTC_21110 [Thermosporothrix sp. COM3]
MTRPSHTFGLSPQRLQHIRWIGGGSGAGKSTIARRLSEQYGVRLYHCDDMQSAHTARSNPIEHPMLHAFIAMTMDERWAKRTPEEMFRTFHGFHGEGFKLILEDLLDLPTNVLILVEGYQLLPRLVAPLLREPNQAVWLLPTSEWRRTAFCRRGSLWSIAGQTSDPQTALTHLLARDALYTEELKKQATALQLPCIQVDGSISIEELTTHVARCLGLKRQ